jgi:transcriptional repressor of dcmA and dcmR
MAMSEGDELLTIKEAAELLKVSETSLRRWTNSGELASFRIGKRRERRFRRKDLLGFLQHDAALSSAPVTSGDVSLWREHGTAGATERSHLCGVYASEDGLAQLGAAFLEEVGDDVGGILVAEAPVRERVLARLCARRQAWRTGSDEFLIQADYATSARGQLEFYEESCDTLLAAGARRLRVLADVRRAVSMVSLAHLATCEAEYDRLIVHRFPVLTLCLYDARVFSGQALCDALKGHPDNFSYPIAGLIA